MKAWILGIFLTLVGLTLAAGFGFAGYHLSGKWAFEHWKTERFALGDRFDWKNLAPPPVDRGQNFAEAPLVRGAILGKGAVDARFKALVLPKDADAALGNWMEGRRDDLVAVGRAYGTADLQSVFKPMETILRDLDQATRLMGNRFPIAYEQGEIPALLGFRAAVRTLRVRASMNLHSGHPDLALEDLQTCLRLAEHLKAEPHLISALLRVAILNISLQVAWEGLEDHLWTAPQLATLQGELARIDLLASLKLAWQAERQFGIDGFTALAERRPATPFTIEAKLGAPYTGRLGRVLAYRNLLEYSRYMTGQVDALEVKAHRVYPDRIFNPDAWMKRLRWRRDLTLAWMSIPALVGQTERFARTQALIDEGTVVCALERYRLEAGRYPARLDDLIPAQLQALPHDLVTGGPLSYAALGEDFTLYQVGWNGKSEGGATGWSGEGKERKLDPAKGDWAWPRASR